MSMRRIFAYSVFALVLTSVAVAVFYPPTLWAWLLLGPVVAVGLWDLFQVKHSILRNFPVLGHFRYFFETIRPEIYQYFVENKTDGVPFGRDERSLVYQQSKEVGGTVPFGTKEDVYKTDYEWINHSMAPIHNVPEDMRVNIGGPDCLQPCLASLLNIAAMSYGSLSKRAIYRSAKEPSWENLRSTPERVASVFTTYKVAVI